MELLIVHEAIESKKLPDHSNSLLLILPMDATQVPSGKFDKRIKILIDYFIHNEN
jgi:hypothetical protein